jgi:leader peptidase (prepilin peptidase)/N-methyltransferase
MSFVRRIVAEVRPYARTIAVLSFGAVAWALWVSGPWVSGPWVSGPGVSGPAQGDSGWAMPAFVIVALAGAPIAVIDAHTHRVPNALSYPGIALTAALFALAAAITGDWSRGVRALAACAILGGGYLVLHLVNRRGLGLGDVKLAVLIGLPAGWTGWTAVWWVAVAPFILGGFAALALVARRRATRHTAIAFGPWMLLGAALALTVTRVG